MKEFQGWRKRPNVFHAPCETKECNNIITLSIKMQMAIVSLAM